MDHDARLALSRVLDVHSGDPWHGFSTHRILQGIAAQQAAAKPADEMHSVWEILLHMTAWTHEVASRLSGGRAGEPEDGDWPAVGEVTEERWLKDLVAFDEAQRALSEAAVRVPDGRWGEPVGGGRDEAIGTGKTHVETLEGLALHHAYHAGQIALLKRWLASR
jgi:uncharacterized damage-inducible protein DinB